ncbi:MAG: ATP-binding protein [Oscillospiraceae bacterium]|nr:ATP-binding protein [Oscillospiraceae bacterium]
MAMDGKILAKARNTLSDKKKAKDDNYERRLKNVYRDAPRVRVLDTAIRETMSDLVGFSLGVDLGEEAEDIRLRNLELQDQRRLELLKAGFAEDYLNDEPMCVVCSDTGYVNGAVCACLVDIYKSELAKSLSSLLKLGNETFDSFELSYYDDAPLAEAGISPRRTMEIIYETCVEYARKFGLKSMNLFFNGAPGLGKTFLSACIARVVADNGFSVVYDMATTMLSKMVDVKFRRIEDDEAMAAEVKRYLSCDLLIIDDLGTEMANAYTVSALYELINTRLVTGKKTIVSSNLTIDELRKQYTEQIMSRLEGEYQVLTFRGDDIRRKRNML